MSDERFSTGGKVGGIGWTAETIYLNSLADVNVPSPTDGLVLAYDAVTGKWIATAAGAGSDVKTDVYEAGVQVGTVARAINFDGADFNVTEEAGPGYFTVTLVGTGMSAHDMTGAYHTENATGGAGNVIRATSATAFAWAQLGHGDIGSVTSGQHHAQQHTLSGADHTGDLAYTQIDAIVDIAGVGANNLLSRADHVHTDLDGSSKITYNNLSGIPSTFDPDAHDLTSAYHTDSGLTIGHFLKATGAATFAWGAHGLSASDVGAATTIHNLIDTTNHPVAGLTTGHFLKATGATTYAFGAHGLTEGGAGTDTTAIHDNVSDEIHVITAKAAPVGADVIVIEDSAATWQKKSVLISNLPAGSPSFGAPTGGIDIGDAAVEGTSGDSTRADHQHAFTAPGAGYPLDIAATESDGVATTPARSDHVHAHGTGYLPDAHHVAFVLADFTTAFAAESLANLTTRAHANLSDAPTDAHHTEIHVLATTGPHSGTLPVADIANGTQYQYLRAGASTPEFQARTFTVSATLKSPAAGYTTVWRAPIGCTCTKLEGRQKGGTSTVINARYNGTTDVATADLTLTAADTWYSTTGIAQTAWSATDWMEIEVVTVASATEITFVLTFTEP